MKRYFRAHTFLLVVVLALALVFSLRGNVAASAASAASSLESAESPGLLTHSVEWVVLAIEIAGIVAIVGGGIVATGIFVKHLLAKSDFQPAYQHYREHLGQAILLGLEILVAADIIGTVAIDPTLESMGFLGGIVVIRTFLSFALAVEIEGRWPWERGKRDHREI